VTAGLTTLRLADAAVYARVDEVAATVSGAVDEAFDAVGLPHVVQRAGSMFSVFLTDGVDGRVDDYDTARTQDEAAFRAFFHAMLDAGVHLPPSAFESWFVSASHDDEAVEAVLAALPGAARAAAAAAAGYAGSAEAAGSAPGEGT
jgi:glutamate-1-semialdehyde 2,1-aminomutase